MLGIGTDKQAIGVIIKCCQVRCAGPPSWGGEGTLERNGPMRKALGAGGVNHEIVCVHFPVSDPVKVLFSKSMDGMIKWLNLKECLEVIW